MIEKIFLESKGQNEIIEITDRVEKIVKKSKIKEGVCLIFSLGSTAGLTTIEYEQGLLNDFQQFLKKWVPDHSHYEHCKRWGDCNAVSHILSSLMKTFLLIPFQEGRLLLGPWQNIVFIDFDKRPRKREIIVQLFSSKE